jgi:hypothetical protein
MVLIATTTNPNAVQGGRRLSFKTANYYFVFFSDGTNIVYYTSPDGTTWTGPTTVRACTAAGQFAVWYDGTYAYYAYCPYSTSGAAMYFRRGSISGATITWDTERTVGTYSNVELNCIITDSGGYPWIAYRAGAGTTGFFVTKSNTNDGTWTTQSGFPYQLSIYANGAGPLVPLTNQRVYALYQKAANAQVYGQLWTGSWGSEETVSTSNCINSDEAFYISAVNEGDHVHLVFLKVSTYNIIYLKRTYGTGWGSEVIVRSATTATTGMNLAIDTATNNLFCFWAGSPTADHIYYKKCIAGTWDTDPTDWINESTDHLTTNYDLVCFYKDYASKIGLEYMTKTASPYNVKFEVYTLEGAPPPTAGILVQVI